jgi:hypothetical protein
MLFEEAVTITKNFRTEACANLINRVKEEIRSRAALGKINAVITVTDEKESHIHHVLELLREDGFDVYCSRTEFKPLEMEVMWKIFKE